MSPDDLEVAALQLEALARARLAEKLLASLTAATIVDGRRRAT